MSELAVGQTVQVGSGASAKTATVRFVGQTGFALGDWVGLELEDDSGKNDGSVKDERYFDCPPGRGMFVRPHTVTVIQAAPPPRAAPAARRGGRMGSATAGRPSSFTDPSLGRRQSLNAPSPSPVPRTSRPSSIARSPTKQLANPAPSAAASRTGTPSNPSRVSGVGVKGRKPSIGGARTSMGPPALPAAGMRRQPSATSSTSSRVAPAPTRPRLSMGPARGGLSRTTSGRVMSGESSGNEGGNRSELGSPFKSDGEQALSPVLSRTKALEKLTSGGPASSASPKPPATTTPPASNAASRENEDLKAKLKVLERKRLEDREKIKEIERLQEQRDKLETINKKIEGKFQTTSQENVGLRKQIKETEERLEELEKMQAEHESMFEMATLDREMAEETAEVYKVELDALKQKAEEQDLELEILREENEEFSNGISPEERASTGWLQSEREKQRLREALIRLRDITQEADEEYKATIKSLRADLEEFDAVKEEFEIAKEQLLDSEARAEDLRQQLDDNLGAEAMIEQLSYEKLTQGEQINELRATIDDLEALKEINDELEVNHVQNEKEMQEELDFKDNVIAEQARKAGEQDDAIGEYEYTCSRFRELVTNLQSDLEDLRASHAVNEAESEQLNSKSKMMEDLNQKLRISTEKTQAKTIDLELQRMGAEEAQQHLDILKLFLPESYSADRDSVLALLRFRRLGFKANLLRGFIKERVSGKPHPGHEDDIFAGCGALDKLSWVSSMCDRFVNAISHCSLEEFAKYEGALYELEPVERALDGWIKGLRQNELKEKQCADELQRTIALMTHLGEVHISDGLESFADNVQMKATLMQSHLDSAATAFTVLRGMVKRVVSVSDEGDELAQHFEKRAEAVINQTRSAKVIASKAVRSLDDLRARSLAPTPDTTEVFEQCEAASQELGEMSRKIGIDLHAVLTEEGREEPYTYPEVQKVVTRTILNAFSSDESDLFSTYLSRLRSLTGQISDLAAVCGDLSQTQEFERSDAPWNLRAQELKALKTIPVDAEEELRQTKEHYNQARREIALRDENLSTATLRIETLEARMRDANAKASRIADLETQIADAQTHAAGLRRDIEQQDREARALEADRDKWKKMAGDSRAYGDAADAAGARAGQERAVATAREMDDLRDEVRASHEACAYLARQNHRARTVEQLTRHDWLSEPLLPRAGRTPPAEQRRARVRAEGRDCLAKLLELAAGVTHYDYGAMPADRLAWRPHRSTPHWRGWRDAVAEKARLVNVDGQQQQENRQGAVKGGGSARATAAAAAVRRAAAARLQVRLPGPDGRPVPGSGKEVRIDGPREWEDVLPGRRAPV
ncbi:CAP-Gly domain-containing protein [Xylariaceae sp. FL0804]|nr:CAP-Gly domain-containing protein [Xylariaceae sp. FL0804]